ncbi:hypothetical protein C7W88_21435 (plasmid) [Novosphingobium sp. THN1]|jgi:cyanate permease|nr:hypothetical protein C7W88_21435 [Novosphingobium sp. THN1]
MDTPSISSIAKPREPWALLVPLSLAGFVLIGGMLTSLSVYVSVMQPLLGWSAAEAGAGPVALLIGMSAGNLVISPALRRLGINGTFALGSLLAALAWAAAGWSNTLAGFSLAMAIAGFGTGLGSIVPGIAVLTEAFHARRGLAIGLFIGSCSLASSAMPMATNLLIERAGWRVAFQIIGLAALVLVPVLWRFLPGRAVSGGARVADHSGQDGLNRRGAFHLPAFWVLTLVMTLSMVCMNGVLFNIVTYLKDRGTATQDAVALYSFANFMSLPGLLVGGYLSDRVRVQILFPAILLIQAAGTLALLGMGDAGPVAMAATAAFVVLWGGVAGLPAQAGSLMLREITGSREFPALLAIVFTINGFIGALAPGLTGWLRDATGDYRSAFALFGLVMIASAVAALWCRDPRPQATTAKF